MRLLRRFLPFLTIAVIAAALYDGWIFYARWKARRDGEQAAKAEEARRARQTIDMIGGTGFHIIDFYAAPQVVRRGEHTKLCYGVYGAQQMRIDPEPGDVHPALNNCLEVSPRKDTEYKLSAADGAGHSVTRSVQVRVAP